MGFLTKISSSKAKSDVEGNVRSQKSPSNETRKAESPVKKVDAMAKLESPKDAKVVDTTSKAKPDTSTEAVPQAQVSKEAEKLPTDEAGVKLAADTNSPQKDNAWLTLDDAVSVSEEESLHSEASEGTETSIFKTARGAVGKLAGKITEKLNTPNRPYETLDDSIDQGQTMPESLAIDQLDKPSTSNDEPSGTNKKPNSQKEDESGAAQEMPQDVLGAGKAAIDDKPEDNATANSNEPNDNIRSSDKTTKANNVEATKKDSAKGGVNKKKEWRSAVDAATGFTYYYIRGTQMVTWEKPSDL